MDRNHSSLCDFQNNHKIDLMIFSPNKPKNGGITAGIARAGAGKDSATGNGVDDSDEVRPPGFPQILFLVLRVHYVTSLASTISHLDLEDLLLAFSSVLLFLVAPHLY